MNDRRTAGKRGHFFANLDRNAVPKFAMIAL
jgi:hypothetical protein